MSLHQQLQDDERYGFIKQIADKLFQGIEKIYDTPEEEKRRWIWELVQNAKDVTNTFGKVRIKVTLKEDVLIFEHNGDPFNTKSFTGLIQQVSDKPSNSANPDITGKFGTGFITTHMLSKKIYISGVLDYGVAYKRFDIELDREAEDADKLALKVESLLKKKDELSDDSLFPPINKTGFQRAVDQYDTSFTYPLTPSSFKYAQQGLEDIIDTGVYALLFNPKIEQIFVDDQLKGETFTIRRKDEFKITEEICCFQSERLDGELRDAEVQTIAYYDVKDENLKIAIPIELSNQKELLGVVYLPPSLPTLFKDFPLVGTERWMFGFVSNSLKFLPTEPRDALRLHKEKDQDNKNADINMSLLEVIVSKSISFISELILLKPRPNKVFNLLNSALPPKERQKDVIEFLKELQIKFRLQARKLEIVETADGYKLMEECKFPICPVPDKPEVSLEFYRICSEPFKFVVPIEVDFESWLNIINPERDTWGADLLLTLENLLSYIDNSQTISTIKIESESGICIWLNRLYKFLEQNDHIELYKDYKLLPNQQGALIKLVDAILDIDKSIPEVLKDVAENFDKPYRAQLVNDNIDCSELTRTLTIEKISQELNQEIGKLLQPQSIPVNKLHATCKLCSIQTGSHFIDEERRINMVNHLSLMNEDWKLAKPILPAMETFNFEPALKVAVRYWLFTIGATKTLLNLNTHYLKLENEDKVADWLDKLLQLVAEHPEIKTLLDTFSVFPNQLGELCEKKYLSVDIDEIESELKDIHERLFPKAGLRKRLLNNRISNKLIDSRYEFAQIAIDIDQQIRQSATQLDQPETRNVSLDMINWLSKCRDTGKSSLFSWIEGNKASIVLKSLDKDQESIFKILQSNADFDQLAEIANSEYSLTEFQELSNLADKVGGIDALRLLVNDKIEQEIDFSFLTSLGTHVEDLFKKAFETIDPDFIVIREPIGQDFIIRFPSIDFKVEIKSHAVGRKEVHMSKRQGLTAVQNPTSYALCVLERPVDLSFADVDYFINRSIFITDIGSRLVGRVKAVQTIDEIISSNTSEEGGIDFDNTNYKYRIGKKVWESPEAVSFTLFIDFLKQQHSEYQLLNQDSVVELNL